MKKRLKSSYLFLFICVLFYQSSAFSDSLQNNLKNKETINQNSVLSDKLKLFNDTQDFINGNKNLYFYDDYLLENLLKIPYDKRQYFFPAIHEQDLISHKIKSHPQIIVWKAKKPTVIAPIMQEFARKHLDNLPAVFYHFMDPDYWEKPQLSEQSFLPQPLLTNTPQSHTINSLEIADHAVRSLRESHQLPKDIALNYHITSLTPNDIQQTQHTLKELTAFIQSYEDKDLPAQLRSLIGDKLPETIASPFTYWVKNIQETKFRNTFEQFIQKQGWKNSNEFAVKSDIILRSVRVNRMSLLEAMAFSQLRQENPIQKDEPLTSLQMYFLMYEATPGDAVFVAPYVEELRKIYNQYDFIHIGLPIYID
ncbi:MAG: hypothetical protein IJ440_00490 [Alphaproteobacteria bacterium]|nr:hypothetical protein [Alphaproteobacteria bacterium]